MNAEESNTLVHPAFLCFVEKNEGFSASKEVNGSVSVCLD